MFFALQLDRGNITQVLADNMLTDLGLTTNDYNYGQTVFYLSFLLAEIPSQLVSQKVTRVVRDDPSKGDMHNRQAITFRKFWQTLTDYDMWPLYFIGVTWIVPFAPPTAYLILILKFLGFNTFQINLLTIPSFVIFICPVRHLSNSFADMADPFLDMAKRETRQPVIYLCLCPGLGITSSHRS